MIRPCNWRDRWLAHRETGSIKLAQQLLRHTSVATTSDIYVHTDRMDGVADILGRVLLKSDVAELAGNGAITP